MRFLSRFLSRLPLARKFAVIGALAFAMLLLPTSLVVLERLDVLRAADRERAGIAPAGEALALLQLTQQHRGLASVVIGGDASMEATRRARRQAVDAAVGRVTQALAALGDDALRRRGDAIAAEWSALAAAVDARTATWADSFERHTALAAAQIDLLDEIAAASGIARHPVAAGAHLQQAVLGPLPRLAETMGQLRARGGAVLARGEASSVDRARIEALVDAARANLHAVRRSLDRARSDVTLRDALAAPAAGAFDAAAEGLALAEDAILRAGRIEHAPAAWIAATTRTIDAQFALVDRAFALLGEQVAGHADGARNQLVAVIAGLGVLALLSLSMMFAVTRATTRALASAVAVAEAVADGDLGVRARPQGRDEVARLLRALEAMTARLGSVVGAVRENAESVATASAQIAQGNLDLSARTEEQAAALEQTAATMSSLGQAVRENADHAREANALAVEARDIAARGGAVVGEVVETMHGIDASSRRIVEIIGVIDGIAFQTNILALNAAVEAARAGAEGRGFAVVAGEVRTLAQRVADAAREIKTLIDDSADRAVRGRRLADDAGRTMDEVVASIRRVADLMAGISAADAEQSLGVAQVGDAVGQMDRVTQQNAALVEQSAAAAACLQQQAADLVDAVGVFRLAEAVPD